MNKIEHIQALCYALLYALEENNPEGLDFEFEISIVNEIIKLTGEELTLQES